MGFPGADTFAIFVGYRVSYEQYYRALGLIDATVTDPATVEDLMEKLTDVRSTGVDAAGNMCVTLTPEGLKAARDQLGGDGMVGESVFDGGATVANLESMHVPHDITEGVGEDDSMVFGVSLALPTTGRYNGPNPFLNGADANEPFGPDVPEARERLEVIMMEIAERNPQLYSLVRDRPIKILMVPTDCACCT